MSIESKTFAEWVATVEALRAEKASLVALLREVEWGPFDHNDSYEGFCPCCGGVKPGSNIAANGRTRPKDLGHSPDCRLASAIREEP
jgi:hypothetical protein